MIVTMSPAKLMNFKSKSNIQDVSTPIFSKEADELIEIMETLEIEDIGQLLDINPKLSFDVYQYIHSFHLDKTLSKQAALAYNGIAFQGLEFDSLSKTDRIYGQEHYVILSALYGALRPLDKIKGYRLEMQAKLQNAKGEDLYSFWQDKLTSYMNDRILADDKIWINLMSKEYTKVINRKELSKEIKVITPDFKQETSNGLRQIVVYTKRARGLMTRFIIENKIQDINDLKGFNIEGYTFSEKLSTDSNWIFTR